MLQTKNFLRFAKLVQARIGDQPAGGPPEFLHMGWGVLSLHMGYRYTCKSLAKPKICMYIYTPYEGKERPT